MTVFAAAGKIEGGRTTGFARRFLRWPTRHQLPVSSPISGRALVSVGFGAAIGDAPAELSLLLRSEFCAAEVLLAGSGTQALQVAIEIAWRRAGATGSVALPAFACFDLASAAIGAGVPVSFFDIDAETLAPELGSLERVMRQGASVVVIAPLYGIPVAWEPVAEICTRHGAILIEDAAQGHGAEWRGAPVGSYGALSVLSFGRGKGWTGGGGGALLARESGWLEGVRESFGGTLGGRHFRTVVSLAAQWMIGRPGVYGIPAALPFLRLGETVYHSPVPPRPMSATAAALALQHRPAASAAVDVRRRHAVAWAGVVTDLRTGSPVPPPAGAAAGYLRFPLMLANGMKGFPSTLEARRAGIMESYPCALPELSELRPHAVASHVDVPGATTLARCLVTLPTHHQLTPRDRARIVELLAGYSSKSTHHRFATE